MEEGSLSSLTIIFLLIALHALISLAYAALTNSRESLLREQVETGSDTPPRLHITYQLSLIFVRFGIAATAVLGLADALDETTAVEPGVLYALILFVAALFTIILGDLVPTAVGSTRANSLAKVSVLPMRLLIMLFIPLVIIMVAISKWLSSLFGSSQTVNVYTEEEILAIVEAGEKEGTIEDSEKEMIYSVLQFGDTLAREVMIPRIDIAGVPIDSTLAEALEVFMESGHSRIPVYEDTIDNIKGLLYAKDLLKLWQQDDSVNRSITEMMRKVSFVPESKRADVLLKEMKKSKIHLVVVVDEYGGTAGLVTIEDLVEEIVGDIQDEFDVDEEDYYVHNDDDSYTIDASMNVDDVNHLLDVELPTEENDTLGGYIFTRLGRVPEIGDTLETEQLVIRIEQVDGRRIRKVRATRKPDENAESDDTNPNTSASSNHVHKPQTVTD